MSQSFGKFVYLLKVSIHLPPCKHGFVTQGLGTNKVERCELIWLIWFTRPITILKRIPRKIVISLHFFLIVFPYFHNFLLCKGGSKCTGISSALLLSPERIYRHLGRGWSHKHGLKRKSNKDEINLQLKLSERHFY